MNRKKGQIWMANLYSTEGSHVTKGKKPVMIWQNDMACKYAPITNVIPLTSKNPKIPTHVTIQEIDGTGLTKTSVALCEQIRPIDNRDLIRYLGDMNEDFISEIDKALCNQLDIKREIEEKVVIKEKTITEKETEYIYVNVPKTKSTVEIRREKRKIRSQVIAELIDYIDEFSTFAKMYNNKETLEAYNSVLEVLESIEKSY